MGCVSGPDKMVEDVELEEGETGYIKSNDDTIIDPDIALSYIDEKLQSVLGHFKKGFEGGAENLGATYGAYGSFLPTYQRLPSIWTQPKGPQRVQINITQSPYHLHKEDVARSFSCTPDVKSRERDGTSEPHNMHSDKVQLGDDLVKNVFDLPSDQAAEKLPPRRQPSPKKSLNSSDLKTLKFRIKVGSNKVSQKNVAIYSGLGLNSPSSSLGHSPRESGGIPVESQENPDKSPTHILQMLSTLTLALGPLLSPLSERLTNLLRDIPSEGKSMPALKEMPDHSAKFGDSNSRVGVEDKTINAFRKEDAILLHVKEISGAMVLDSRLHGSSDESVKKQSCSIDINCGSLRNSSTAVDTPKEPVKGNLMKIRKLTNKTIKGSLLGAHAVKDNSFELVSSQGGSKLKNQEARSSSVKTKDSPVDFPESKRNKVNGITYIAKIDSDTLESDRNSKGAAGHLLQEGGLRATSDELDKLGTTDYKKKFPSEGKSKSKVSQVNRKISSYSVDGGRKAGLSASTREKKAFKKDASISRELYEDLFGHSEAAGFPMDLLQKPGSIDTMKDECGNMDRFNVKSGRNKVDHQPTSQSLVKDSRRHTVPPTNGFSSEMEHTTKAMELVQTTVAPVDDWVACDRCQQWRLLPNGRTPDEFPETWVCSMMDWLPGMNNCNFTENETTEALRALPQPPLPANPDIGQYNADRAVTGVRSVDTRYKNLGNPNVANGSKKHKVKETGSKSVLNLTNIPRNIDQGPVRWENLNAKQTDSGMKLIRNSFSQTHSSSGEAKLKRNSKRVSDQHVHPTAKKVKTEFGSPPSLPIEAPVEVKQELNGCIWSKGAKSEEGIVLQARKPKGDIMDTNGGSFDMRDSSDSHVSLKKRKLMDWKNSQNNVVAMRNDGHPLPDNKVPELENSVTGFKKNRKPTVSQTDGSLFSGTNGELEVAQKDNRNRKLSSGGVKDPKIDKGVDKEKQFRELKIKVTSRLTMDDLESLKKDLASEPVLVAATSSSSKVSGSRKTRFHYSENRGSPVESVSSSPLRMSTIDKPSPLKVESLSHDDVKAGEGLGDVNHQNAASRSVKNNKMANKVSKKYADETRGNESKCGDHVNLVAKVNHPCTAGESVHSHVLNQGFQSGKLRKNLSVVDCGDEKSQMNQHSQDKHDLSTKVSVVVEDEDPSLAQPHYVPGWGELSKESKDFKSAVHNSETLKGSVLSAPDRPASGSPSGQSALRSIASVQGASAVLKEAERLRDYADHLKGTVFGYECNETYFQAALKFLLSASLMERSNESGKHGEINQMQIYISSATLCETCAAEYERHQEMAAAALAYKCMEVAYMRVVYCKNVPVNRLCHDLQASLQPDPQGESPSSSASDIDNLNNHVLVEKSSFCKSNGTNLGNHILASRRRPSFARLLDFTKDVNCAMEASRKSLNALTAANVILEKGQNKEAIVSVKRVINFSFQDVEELVRLVGYAKEAISRKALCGNRN